MIYLGIVRNSIVRDYMFNKPFGIMINSAFARTL